MEDDIINNKMKWIECREEGIGEEGELHGRLGRGRNYMETTTLVGS